MDRIFVSGLVVQLQGEILRTYTPDSDNWPDWLPDGGRPDIPGYGVPAIGTPDSPNYAYWYKAPWPVGNHRQALVLGWTYKLSGKVHASSMNIVSSWGGEPEEEYDPGGIEVASTGLAWVVMPLHGLQPGRYCKPVITIEEFMWEVNDGD